MTCNCPIDFNLRMSAAELKADELRALSQTLCEKIAKLESYVNELEMELAAADAAIDDAIERLKRKSTQ